MNRSPSVPVSAAAFLGCALLAPAVAQCDPQWQPGPAAPGIAGVAHDAALLPNGHLVVGGDFQAADATLATYVARWDGATWHAVNDGTDGIVNAVAVLPNGHVVVGGEFFHAGGPTSVAFRVAQWTGTTWLPLGGGVNGIVRDLLALPNGDVIACGDFTVAGGVAAAGIARWNGTAWSALGSGLTGVVTCLELLANGDVIAAGSFTQAGGVPANAVARWNGATWAAEPGLDPASQVVDVEMLANGTIVVVGYLRVAGVQTAIAVLGSPGAITPPSATTFSAVTALANGDLVVGGAAFPGYGSVSRWDGTAWSSLGGPVGSLALLEDASGGLIAAGRGSGTGVGRHDAVARYDGTSWSSLGGPRGPEINAVATLRDGAVVVGGDFTSLGGVAANNVAVFRAGAYTALGTGVAGTVTAVAADPDGSIVVCGDFAVAGGVAADRVARWNGSSWSPVGTGLTFAAKEVCSSQGRVIARFNTLFRYFDGTAWAPLQLPLTGAVTAMVARPQAGFVIGGQFSTQFGYANGIVFDQGQVIATLWHPTLVTRLGIDVYGRVLATVTTGVGWDTLRLDGYDWVSLGSPPVAGAITSLPNGDPLVAGGTNATTLRLFRHDGAGWQPLAGTILTPSWATSAPGYGNLGVACSRDGDVFVGGEVVAVNGTVSLSLAHATPSCPASAVVAGQGCTGTAGPLGLAADRLPWIGGTFSGTASGFPANALAVHVLGTQATSVPLPLGAPGCDLFTLPVLTEVLLPANGTAVASFAAPRSLALVGLTLRQQVVGVELGAGGHLSQLTGTNALALTIGAL